MPSGHQRFVPGDPQVVLAVGEVLFNLRQRAVFSFRQKQVHVDCDDNGYNGERQEHSAGAEIFGDVRIQLGRCEDHQVDEHQQDAGHEPTHAGRQHFADHHARQTEYAERVQRHVDHDQSGNDCRVEIRLKLFAFLQL